MIHKIFSSLPTFKTLSLHSGLNVLLSDKTENSTQKQTRNSAGKSSIVEVVHFVLGAQANPESIFRNDVLREHEFGMDVEIGGLLLSVTRTGQAPGSVRVLYLKGERSGWAESYFRSGTELVLTISEWREILGRAIFRIPPPKQDEPENYRPTFRGMISYFARRASAEAFQLPIEQSKDQQPWDQQVMVSYLLGLDWELVGQSQRLRDRVKALNAIKKAAGKELSSIVGLSADLLAQVTNLEIQTAERRKDVEEFRVLPTFHEYSANANEISKTLHELKIEYQANARRVESLRQALNTESAPQLPDVARLYDEAGITLPRVALRRYDDVTEFHESVVANRRSYLRSEMLEAEFQLRRGAEEMERLDRSRAEIFRILKSGGALEDLSAMQADLASKEAAVNQLRNRYETAKALEANQKEIKAEGAILALQLQRATEENEPAQKRAISVISRIFRELYGHPGALLINPSEKGLEIAVRLDGDRGKGIKQMSIFAFDVMLAVICAERSIGPSFLIHDSHLFDGVDDRQIATALMIGKRELAAVDCQYLVLLNSDELPDQEDQPPTFDITDSILDVRLTDASETGGLFGLRFN